MDKELQKLMPLEFQKINEIKKVKKKEIPKKNPFVEVNFYQSNKVEPEMFYKPISKLIHFEF